ncbi:hypothetical protein FPOAC1_003412 [Fusarium poae]|uniref:hypothetical protein n=1 Tax=Fusarium poae TaxID=36050 RepID=UPI001CE7C847|nr:hypothetical protein FPOAC1_003412 [Fusarium poae]KAG8677396.1 hypothetical protein FPOAC1_003412 [Fusarium poae]
MFSRSNGNLLLLEHPLLQLTTARGNRERTKWDEFPVLGPALNIKRKLLEHQEHSFAPDLKRQLHLEHQEGSFASDLKKAALP